MKIAVTSTGPTLDAPVDYRFGRCAYFIIVDTYTMEYQAVPNPTAAAPGGAGTMAAQFVASQGVSHVITGEVGPNAYPALIAAGVTPITGATGSVREVVEAFKSGKLQSGTSVGWPPGVPAGWAPAAAPVSANKTEELKFLKAQLETLKGQLNSLLERIDKLEKEEK